MRFWLIFAFLLVSVEQSLALEENDLIGTWRLVSAKNKILETGEMADAYGGPHPNGWITYGKDKRMMVVCAYDQRATPTSKDAFSDQERIALQKSFFAYAGTYEFDGSKITHAIDTSSNQIWTGLRQVRNVEEKDGKIIYTTQPQMNNNLGKMVVVTLVWEKYQ
jgi:hypothetical protein